MSNTKFERLSLEEGLSQSVVYSIIQDKEGFIWMGTQDGLNRYDGYNFMVYKNDPKNIASISNNYVKSVFEDSEGILWSGTLKGVLSKFDKLNNQFLNFNINLTHILPEVRGITCICEDDEGFLWIGSDGGGLNKFDKEKNEFIILNFKENLDCDMDDHITCLRMDADGLLWIGTWNNGIYLYNHQNNIISNFRNNPENISSLSNNLISDIFEDSRKNILVSTRKGLNIFNKSDQTFEHFLNVPDNNLSISGNAVSCVCEDKNNCLWMGTKGKGLNKFNIQKKSFETFSFDSGNPDSISNDSIFSLYVDRSNVLWIGTFGGGLSKLDCEKKKFFSMDKLYVGQKLISLKEIFSIYIDSYNLKWIGTLSKGLFVIFPESNNVSNYDNENSNLTGTSIMCLYEDLNSEIWVGTFAGGLNKYNRLSKKFTFHKYNDDASYNVYSICGDNYQNYLWVGTHNYGLLKFDLRNEKFVKITDNSENEELLLKIVVKSLYVDVENIIWIGTNDNGLLKYDIDNDILKIYRFDNNIPGSISDDNITIIFLDRKRNFWIGTHGGGINRYDSARNNFVLYSEDQGLPDTMVKSILEDESGNLWLSTNNHISRFNLKTETFRNYDYNDGLLNKEFNDGAYFQSREGTFYFGGINGYTYFKPEEIKDNFYIPNIVITDFQIFNKSVESSPQNPFLKTNISFAKEITLSYRESVFSFEFSALIYNNPLKNRYAYMMEGFDKDWIYCGSRRQATYTNLDPGNYVFWVKGSNNDGIWNETGTSVNIRITPPFWKTFWFKGLGLISIAGATGLTYKQRIDKIKKEQTRQEEFTKKLIEFQENDRKRIAAELHDSLGQNLAIINNKAIISGRKTEDQRVKEQMNEISGLTSSVLNEVKEISYNLRPYELDRLGLSKTLLSLAKRAGKSTNINFNCDLDKIDNVFSPEIEINIYRIIQECFTNIIKHSEATDVLLLLKKLEKEISIFISDNGRGFDLERKFSKTERKGFGLTGIPERVKLFGGKFNIESEPDKGTRINIVIPFLKK